MWVPRAHVDIVDELLPLCACALVRVHVRMYVCMYVCMHLCACVRVVLVLDEASAAIDYETDRLLRVRNH